MKIEFEIQRILDISFAVFMAGAGGFVRVLFDKERHSLKSFIIEIIIASFAGIIMHYIIRSFNFDEQLRAALIGIAGFSARELLYIIKHSFLKRVKGKI